LAAVVPESDSPLELLLELLESLELSLACPLSISRSTFSEMIMEIRQQTRETIFSVADP
jgi:hypothetical protein